MSVAHIVRAVLALGLLLTPARGSEDLNKPYAPKGEPDMRMECAVIEITYDKEQSAPNSKRSPPFRLFVELYFEDAIGRFSDNYGVTNYDLPITSIQKLEEYREKLITAKRGPLVATINLHFKDVFISDIENGQLRKAVGGRDCRIDQQG